MLIHEAFNAFNLYSSEFNDQNSNFINQQQKFVYCICLPSLWISFSLAHNSSTSFSIPHFWKQQRVMIFISFSCTHTDYKFPDLTTQRTQHLQLCNILHLRATAWQRQGMMKKFCLIFSVSCRASIYTTKGCIMTDMKSFETYHFSPPLKGMSHQSHHLLAAAILKNINILGLVGMSSAVDEQLFRRYWLT